MTEVAAVVLAAGTASRYRALDATVATKLVAEFRGKPLVRWAVEAALASRAAPVVIVTGHAREAVEAALSGLAVGFVDNPDFARGLATSLKVGIASLPRSCGAAAIVLGDMPLLKSAVLDRLIEAFVAVPASAAVVPMVEGQRGNPVILARSLFDTVMRLEGDDGARRLLRSRSDVVEVSMDEAAVTEDIDTPAALARAIETALHG